MPAAAIGGIIAGVGSVASAVIGGHAASSAADAQAQSAQAAIDEQRRQFDLTRSDTAPWRTAGAAAIGQLSDMLKPGYDYTASPGYDWRFAQGQRAVDSSAAAKGLDMSGGTLKDLTRFGQGLAASDYTDQFNRVASVAQGGQQVNESLGTLGANSANNIGNLLTQQGNARASGYVGSANAITGGINNLAYLAQQHFGGGSQPLGSFGIVPPSYSLSNNVNATIAANPSIF